MRGFGIWEGFPSRLIYGRKPNPFETALALVTHGVALFKVNERCFYVARSAESQSSRSGLMRLMEPPECRYQFCHDSHDLAAGQPVGTLSKFIGRSTVRKQPPSPSSECFMIFLCARAYLIRPRKTLLSCAKKPVPPVVGNFEFESTNEQDNRFRCTNKYDQKGGEKYLLFYIFVRIIIIYYFFFFSFALYHFK